MFKCSLITYNLTRERTGRYQVTLYSSSDIQIRTRFSGTLRKLKMIGMKMKGLLFNEHLLYNRVVIPGAFFLLDSTNTLLYIYYFI